MAHRYVPLDGVCTAVEDICRSILRDTDVPAQSLNSIKERALLNLAINAQVAIPGNLTKVLHQQDDTAWCAALPPFPEDAFCDVPPIPEMLFEDLTNGTINAWEPHEKADCNPAPIKVPRKRGRKKKPVPENQPVKKKRQPINQYSLEGIYITSFVTAKAAERATGINASGINHAILRKHETAGGFQWRTQRDGFLPGVNIGEVTVSYEKVYRLSKQGMVQAWRKAHPNGTPAECKRDTGITFTTISKWWNT